MSGFESMWREIKAGLVRFWHASWHWKAGAAVVAIIAIGGVAGAGCGGDNGETNIEQGLAKLHGDSSTVGEFRRLMEALDSYCPESPERIADYLVAADQQLAEGGRGDITLLEFTDGLADLLSTEAQFDVVGDSCADEVATLVTTLLA